MKDYYIGLDIGTDSVGWAVCDTDYKLCKFKGNSMWGIRLFDESNTAEERRTFRTGRRRGERKRQRIEWLQMLFNTEISGKDPAFFQRLKESNLYLEDKSVNTPYAVFADKDFTDIDFHKKYPTIYHLRKELIENKAPHDVRLVYLALHNLIKSRGHFLFENLETDFQSAMSFDTLVNDWLDFLNEEYEITIQCSDYTLFSSILKDKTKNKTTKSSEIYKLLNLTKKENQHEMCVAPIIRLISLKGFKQKNTA